MGSGESEGVAGIVDKICSELHHVAGVFGAWEKKKKKKIGSPRGWKICLILFETMGELGGGCWVEEGKVVRWAWETVMSSE